MGITLTYDTKTCGRCGGSGSYSYCSMYGSTCFGCSGRKMVVTAAGAKAAKAVAIFKAEHFSVRVEDLKPGDRISIDGKTRTIATVTTKDAGRYGVTGPDGTVVWHDYVTVTFTKPVPSAMGPYSSHGFPGHTTVVRAISGADWDAVVAFAKTIKKGVTVGEAVKTT